MILSEPGRALVRLVLASLLILGVLGSPAPARAAMLSCDVQGVAPLAGGAGWQVDLQCDLAGRGILADAVTLITTGARPEGSWPEIADIEDAVWIFDYGADRSPELVIRSQRVRGALVAELYDSQGIERRLNYTLDGASLQFRNELPPTIRVFARDGWWQRGGVVNFNLEILVDGLLDAAFDIRSKLRGHVETDGTVDIIVQVRDENRDGRPDHDWRTVRQPESQPRALQLTYLTVNACGNEPRLDAVWPWPYLGPLSMGYLTAGAHETSEPPIQMDWESGTLMAVGEFVSSRGNDCQWFIYSNEELQPGRPNRANFENPFAWYDVADDRDGKPELSIRQVYFDANDPLFVRGNVEFPVNVIRYSWDQNNDDHWSYKLGLLGSHPLTSTVRVGDAEIVTVPYDELPGWVIDRSWSIATFVAAEGVRARGEGIYTWDPSTWLTERYYTGLSDSPWPPADVRAERAEDQLDISSIPAGYRGEYQLNLGQRVRLYVSAVDQKLHLFGSSHGTWNIDDRSEMQYADRDGDGYIDSWRYLIAGELEQSLDFAGSYMVHSSRNEVVIKQTDAPGALWEGPPPTDHETWQELGELLAPFEPDLSLSPEARLLAQIELQRMIDRVDGPTTRIRRATVRDFRPDEAGFRFVLDLHPGYRISGADLLPINGQPSGGYLVTSGSPLTVRDLTPASLVLDVMIPDVGPLVPRLPVPVRVRMTNSGLADASELTLKGWARHEGQQAEFPPRSVAVLSQQAEELDVTWHPAAAGQWELELWLEAEDGTILARAAETVTISAAEAAASRTVAYVSTSQGWRLPAFALLVAIVLVTAVAVRRATHGTTGEVRR